MPDNGSGVYTLPPVYLGVAGQTIRAEQHNTPLQDLEEAQNRRLRRDGTTPMLDNLPMNGNRVTNLGVATQPSDAARLDQVMPYNAFIASMAALTFAANEAAYATGPTTAAKMSITAFARSLLDDIDAAAARETLGLQAGATAPSQLLSAWYAGSSAVMSVISPAQLRLVIQSASVGVGQQWRDDTALYSAVNTPYQNLTSGPVQFQVSGDAQSAGNFISVSTNGSTWVEIGPRNVNQSDVTASFILPSGHYWRRERGVNPGSLTVAVLV